MIQQRDYSNLKESERVWDAVKLNGTPIKDYSLTHLCGAMWRRSEDEAYKRFVTVVIGGETWVGRGDKLAKTINDIADQQDRNGWFPRQMVSLLGQESNLIIDTVGVNEECLRDHVAEVTINGKTAIIDLEELLKATRYY